SSASAVISSPPSWVATDEYDATARPPAARISDATASAAGPSGVPTPSKSLTTRAAPRRASSSAYARPRPSSLPAPVTIATWPASEISVIWKSSHLGSELGHHSAPHGYERHMGLLDKL